MREVVAKGAVKAGGQYSSAIVANGFVFVSGQGPVRPDDGGVPDGFGDQVHQTLRNLETVLHEAGAALAGVVKINAYLADVTRFREFDNVYREFFAELPPARTTVGAQLIGIQVEIDCVAVLPECP